METMGLDQFAYSRKPGEDKATDIAYWRQHNALQGWMENLWREKGNDGVFNDINVDLSDDDLEKLREDILAEKLPETCGFLFGTPTHKDNPYREEDLEFIETALAELKKGNTVYYYCWW